MQILQPPSSRIEPVEFRMKHVLRSQQFTPDSLEDLFLQAQMVERLWRTDSGRNWLSKRLKGKMAYIVFAEASTRTRFSLEAACKALGMDCIVSDNAAEMSSMVKGERMEHMFHVLCRYSPHVIIMRQKQNGLMDTAAQICDRYGVRLINAGDGTAQHPTQALLDVYTIIKRLGRLHDLKILIGGDLLRGRTVHSLAYLLAKYFGNKITFASPKELALPQDILDHLIRHGVTVEICNENWRGTNNKFDVIYWTRVQSERSKDNAERLLFEEASRQYILGTQDLGLLAGQDSIVMHPLPIKDEVLPDMDDEPRAVYLNEQVENGLYIRIALLLGLFNIEITNSDVAWSKFWNYLRN